MTTLPAHPLDAHLRDHVDELLTRLARLHAASVSLTELADSVGRDGSTATLLACLDTLERDFELAGPELARVRFSARPDATRSARPIDHMSNPPLTPQTWPVM